MVQDKRLYWLLIPCMFFLLAFFVIPLLISAFGTIYQPGHGFIGTSYIDFFRQKISLDAYLRSICMGVLVTLLSAIISYPVAIAIVGIGNEALKTTIMLLVMLPLMTNPVARTFAWLVILGRNGILNQIFLNFGFVDKPIKFLYTNGAIFIGLLQLFMPFMILSLTSALENISEDYTMAARSLGASGFQAFTRIKFPLTIEGLITGGILVFTGSITAYVTPAILGGSKIFMLSTLLYQKASVTHDWHMATTIAMIMFLTTLGVNRFIRFVGMIGRSK